MASIFLSYARDDAAKAGRIAEALQSAGHEVWWDRNIGAGTRFAAEIEDALKAADRVVVLWSKTSIRSAWVLDEAAAGRDTGRLIPVLIDPVEPPLGFRQYQSVDLSGGRRGAKALAPLLGAIGTGSKAEKPHEAPPTRAAGPLPWKLLLIALGGLLLIGGGWWLLSTGRPSDDAISVSVAAGNSDPRSTELARSIALDLSSYRAGPLGSLAILDPSDKSNAADYQVNVTASGDAAGFHADVAMRSHEAKGLLWSRTIEGAGREMVDVRQQASANLGDVLTCLVQVRHEPKQPSHDVLGMYLSACTIDIDSGDGLSIYRSITGKAPDFAPGWSGLALLESEQIGFSPSEDPVTMRQAAAHHLALARRIDPDIEDGFVAEANLLPVGPTTLSQALKVIDRGLAAHPDSALLHGSKSALLQSAGRMNDAVSEAEQAAELNPVSPGVRGAVITALAFAGRTKEAFGLLDQADRIWPGSKIFAQTRYILNLRFGDAAAALKYLRDQGSGKAAGSALDEAWVAFLEARMDPTPVRTAKALDAFRARNLDQQVPITGYVQALGTFARTDEFYAVVARPESLDGLRAGSDVLFRAHMKSVRYDPRFMTLSKQLGLVDYWQHGGHWPDFCNDPRLPYNCKAEAAKLARIATPRG